jgi:hypothetical protein
MPFVSWTGSGIAWEETAKSPSSIALAFCEGNYKKTRHDNGDIE